MNKNSFIRTDLATELRESLPHGQGEEKGFRFDEYTNGNVKISDFFVITPQGEQLMGKPMGRYVTLSFGKVWLMTKKEWEHLSSTLGKVLKEMIRETKIPVKKVLVAGLGNRNLTADAVGPFTAEKITLTRPIALSDPELFARLGHLETSVIIPCVSGETGIESADLVKSASDIVKPDIIIAIDALAARSPDRLMGTIQLSNTGISPGSGVGNSKLPLNKDSLGVPVIAIGIPTVVDSSTLVYDALEKSGMAKEDLPHATMELLNNNKSFFVSARECDVGIKELTDILSTAIDKALSVSY